VKKIIITFIAVFSAISTVYAADPIVTDSTSNSTTNSTSKSETTVKSPPPTAVAPAVTTINNDVCATASSGAVQTQILGISAGTTFTEENCLRLKNAKTLYDMGMKVAAVSVMCQDENVFDAMMMAGTPCPYEGQIGEAAKIGWESHEESQLEKVGAEEKTNVKETATWGITLRVLLHTLERPEMLQQVERLGVWITCFQHLRASILME